MENNKREEIPLLQDLCVNIILKSNSESIFYLYSLSDRMLKEEWKRKTLNYISMKFIYFLDKYGENNLKEILNNVDYERLYQQYQDNLITQRRFSVKVISFLYSSSSFTSYSYYYYEQGNVIEPQIIEISPEECKDGYYPLKLLLSGVAWPNDVDATKREQYLHPDEFMEVFGCTKVFRFFLFQYHI